MNFLVSIVLILLCAMSLATRQGQAKKGCDSYGYACYGGHGKRSLNTQQIDATGIDLNELQQRPESMPQFYPNEANVLIDANLEEIPRYKLIKMMKAWFARTHRRPGAERLPEFDYPLSDEFINHENNPAINNNPFK